MSSKKRKSLDETLANQFVYGEEPQPEAEPISSSPSQSTPQPTPTPPTNTLMEKLTAETKEPTTRLTVDLPQSVHRKLSLLAARTGRKKAEIIRYLLDEALKDVQE